ncbi:MAG: restriction endonuclease, partial [Pyrinomonadaceae bacterium]
TRVGLKLPNFKVQRLEKLNTPDGVYEIDVTARFEVLGAQFLVLIECKHHKNPIKRDVVQLLHDRVRAVGAHKGMIFSTGRFQRGAIQFARAHRIALIQIIEGSFDKKELPNSKSDLFPWSFVSIACISNNARLDSNLRRMEQDGYEIFSELESKA